MQSYLAPRPLKSDKKPDKDVHVFFATQPNRRAVLFIHGYSGDALDTWSDFHLLLPDCAPCNGRDLYFYGYDGLRAEMTASASLFRKFLASMFHSTANFVNENLSVDVQRPADFAYDELLIVAHSLGAVIARRALLDATLVNAPWVSKTGLVLFAPAHKGATVADLAVEAAQGIPILKYFVSSAARFASPLIEQLKVGSADLESLLKETEEACKDGKNRHLIARRVVIAEYENIVRNERFGYDPPGETIPDATHKTVCKPSATRRDPLDHLEACL